MYKVIIADDEQKILELIKNLIDWKTLSLELVAEANDGETALQLIEKYHPDIMICDIRMPGLNGLELIKKSKELFDQINYIVISGYKHFDYAHKAIRYGVEDYLLKPIKQEELNATLKKIVEKRKILFNGEGYNLEVVKTEINPFWKQLFSSSQPKHNFIPEIFGFMYPYFELALLKVDLNSFQSNSETDHLLFQKSAHIINKFQYPERIKIYILQKDDLFYLLINSPDKVDRMRSTYLEIIKEVHGLRDLFPKVDTTVFRSGFYSDLNKSYDFFYNIQSSLYNRIFRKGGDIVLLKEGISFSSNFEKKIVLSRALKKNLQGAIEILDIQRVKNELDLSFNYLNDGEINFLGYAFYFLLIDLFDLFLSSLKQFFDKTVEISQVRDHFLRVINSSNSYIEMKDFFFLTVEKLILNQRQLQQAEEDLPIRAAKEYIKENYFMNITLEDISHEVGLNPTYFSSLFKKKTDIGFLEYLTMIRVEESKDLLANPKRSIADTASEVGYKDSKYFTKQFKKIVGLSPNEYRKIYF